MSSRPTGSVRSPSMAPGRDAPASCRDSGLREAVECDHREGKVVDHREDVGVAVAATPVLAEGGKALDELAADVAATVAGQDPAVGVDDGDPVLGSAEHGQQAP